MFLTDKTRYTYTRGHRSCNKSTRAPTATGMGRLGYTRGYSLTRTPLLWRPITSL